jgi:hypothetical protein
MKREHLVGAVRERLKRYPEPYSHHYGVVPLPPTEEAISLGAASPAHLDISPVESARTLCILAGAFTSRDPTIIQRHPTA